MLTKFYLFDPEKNILYGPDDRSHYDLMHNEKLAHNLSELIDKEWVRIYYNQHNNELGISCNKNKFALKAIREFNKKEAFFIKSLFLDVSDIHCQDRVIEENIKLYIKYGKIELDKNL